MLIACLNKNITIQIKGYKIEIFQYFSLNILMIFIIIIILSIDKDIHL